MTAWLRTLARRVSEGTREFLLSARRDSSLPLVIFGALLGSLTLLTIVLCVLRLSGSFTVALPWPGLLATGLLLAAACAAARLIWFQSAPPGSPRWLDHVARFLPLVDATMITTAILLPGTSVLGTCLYVGLLAVEESLSCLLLPWTPSAGVWDDETIDQQTIRRRTTHAGETLEGWLRVRFLPGQRTSAAHLSFCPPFARTPDVTFVQIAGPDARIRLAQTLPFGIRLEVKLPHAAPEESCVLVEFAAASDDAATEVQTTTAAG